MNHRRSSLAASFLAFTLASPLRAETVHGTVTGPDNKPIAGASVLLISPRLNKAVKVQTGADGSWTGELPDKATDPRLGQIPEPYASFVGVIVVAPGQGFGAKLGKKGEAVDFALPATTSIGGTITDDKGTPLAGVELEIKAFYSKAFDVDGRMGENQIPFDIMESLYGGLPAIMAKSDADGKWKINGVPQGMRMALTLADDNYNIRDFTIQAGTLDAAVKASPGSSIKGRLLLPDGKPAAGITVSGPFGKPIKTDAEGRFDIHRITPGDVWISFSDESKVWIGTSRNVNGVKAGEVRDIGDTTLSKGLEVTGKVVDETGKGIGGAQIFTDGDSAVSGADGSYTIRTRSTSSWISATREGYLNSAPNGDKTQAQIQVTIPPGTEKYTAPMLKLQRGVYVTGTAKDEAGQPAVGAVFNSGQRWENPASGTVDKDGNFRFGPLMPGADAVLLTSDIWDLASPVKIKAPLAANEATSPKLQLTLKKITLKPVKGRVVSTDGKPVPGVAINFRIYFDDKRSSWSNGDITSGADGSFTFGALRPEQTPGYDSIKSDDYAYVKSEIPKLDGDHWNFGDVVVSTLDGKISGQVVDAAGNAVAGAKVVLAGTFPWKPVVSGEDGRFVMEKLPHNDVTLLAAKDHLFGRQIVQAGPDVKLTLVDRPAPGPEDGKKLLISKAGEMDNVAYSGAVPPLDADFALSLLKKDAAGNPKPDLVASLIASVAGKDPAKAAQWGIPLWQKLPEDNQKIEEGTTLARAVVPYDREFSSAWLKTARAKMKRNDFSAEAANNFIALAGLAAALGDPQADDLLDLGLTAADRSVAGDKRTSAVGEWGKDVAASPELVDRLIEEMEPEHQMRGLAGAVQGLAPIDLKAAQALMPRLMDMGKLPVLKDKDAKINEARQNGGEWHETSGEIIGRAQEALALAMAANPGPGAGDMAKQMSEEYRRAGVVLQVARRYVKAGHTADAANLLRSLGDDAVQWDNVAGLAPTIALSFDKKLADEIFARDLERISRDNERSYGNGYRTSMAAYAWSHAPLDAGESRLMLENEWEWRLNFKKGQNENEAANYEWQMRPLLLAMTVLDLPRALEMLGQMSGKYGRNDDVKWKMGVYLVTGGQTNLLGYGDEDF